MLNVVISVTTVYFWGLIGVAIGTVVAMVYQMVWMAYYDSKHLLKWPFMNFLKQILIDALTAFMIWLATSWIRLGSINYLSWFWMAIEVAIIALIITLCMMFLFHRKKLMFLYRHVVCKKKH